MDRLTLKSSIFLGSLFLPTLSLGAEIAPPPPPPAEMQEFAFLIGKWACSGVWRQADGALLEFDVIWQGKSLLDGHAQVEEYRAVWPGGETFVYGLNYRMFDDANNRWVIKWYDVLHGASFDLGQPLIVGSEADGRTITFTTGDDANLNRAIYKNIAADGFSWQGDSSSDGGESWDMAVMKIDCLPAQD